MSDPTSRDPHEPENASHKPARPRAKRKSGRLSNKDIGPILRGWDYEPGNVNVRKVVGLDGAPKLQMRVDLGLLQMEITGRPDGRRPHGCESLLDYFEGQLEGHRHRNGTELGFHLSGAQCQSLREEAWMYSQRYLSLFVLEDFDGVLRDTERNLRVLDLCGRFASDEQDRLILEQYRPYIIMMNVRAKASSLFEAERHQEALDVVERGLADLRQFFQRFDQEQAFVRSSEARMLKRLAREIRRKIPKPPVDPIERLQRKLDRAIKDEYYEQAARLRDKIAEMRAAGENETPDQPPA